MELAHFTEVKCITILCPWPMRYVNIYISLCTHSWLCTFLTLLDRPDSWNRQLTVYLWLLYEFLCVLNGTKWITTMTLSNTENKSKTFIKSRDSPSLLVYQPTQAYVTLLSIRQDSLLVIMSIGQSLTKCLRTLCQCAGLPFLSLVVTYCWCDRQCDREGYIFALFKQWLLP